MSKTGYFYYVNHCFSEGFLLGYLPLYDKSSSINEFDGWNVVVDNDRWIFKWRILFLLKFNVFNFFNDNINGILKYSKRFSDKSNRSKFGNRLTNVSISSIWFIEHDCNDNCVNFLDVKICLFVVILNEFDKSNERKSKRFKLGNSDKICKNVFVVNCDVKIVVENINSSK